MKKIINGHLYNTDTASKIGFWNNGYKIPSMCYCSETLYKKRNGEFFLHGYGGALSAYGEFFGNIRRWGNRIIPLTLKEAKGWAKKHISLDKYLDLFKVID